MLALANNFYLLTHYTKGTVKHYALPVFSIEIQSLFIVIIQLLTFPSRYFSLSISLIISLEQARPSIQLFLKKIIY